MRLIKRLYLFILKSFIPLFAMTFFIVLFIVLMQFLWRYIDDLVGKGLSVGVIAELFFYAAVSMVPMALPLAILLASLMTFGNLGEKFELTAMKASGVSLLKSMRPLIVLISIVAVGAFFFQNNVLPKAQVKMWTLLFSMKQKSPELEIPEGVFYDQIPGYNIFVKGKDQNTGILYDVMIYDVSRGGDNSTILVADSSRLAFTGDMRYLYLHLFNGEQFENLREQKSMDRNVPFRRETFLDKEVLIPFDANFNRLDEGGMRNQYVGKNITELRHTVDSIDSRLDSIGRGFAEDLRYSAFPLVANGFGQLQSNAGAESASCVARPLHRDSTECARGKKEQPIRTVDIDSLLSTLSPSQMAGVFDAAANRSRQRVSEYQFKSMTMSDDKKIMRRHEIELIKKYTLSVACVIFFFIGAPLGAIIRKGGLGTPLVISVLLFLVYYIIDNTGYKMARDGRWAVWFGMWLSTFVLAPLGMYVTYKAMNDSAVFDPDRLKLFFRRMLGLKEDRSVSYKEVIINDVSDAEAVERLDELREMCLAFANRNRRPQGYSVYWLSGYDPREISEISSCLESTVSYLTDCRNQMAVNKLMDFPVIRILWVCHPASVKWLGRLLMYLFPVGLPVYLFGLREQRLLKNDLRRTAEVCVSIIDAIRGDCRERGEESAPEPAPES